MDRAVSWPCTPGPESLFPVTAPGRAPTLEQPFGCRASEPSRSGHAGERQLQGRWLCSLGWAGLPMVQLLQLLTQLGVELLHSLATLQTDPGCGTSTDPLALGLPRGRHHRPGTAGQARVITPRCGGRAPTWPVGSRAFCRASSLEGATLACKWRRSRSTCRCTFSFLEEARARGDEAERRTHCLPQGPPKCRGEAPSGSSYCPGDRAPQLYLGSPLARAAVVPDRPTCSPHLPGLCAHEQSTGRPGWPSAAGLPG